MIPIILLIISIIGMIVEVTWYWAVLFVISVIWIGIKLGVSGGTAGDFFDDLSDFFD